MSAESVLILSRGDVEYLLSMAEAIAVVESSFYLCACGQSIMPPKLYLELPQYEGDFRAMPAYINDGAGMKWVSVYPKNQKHNLPTVLATILLCDSATGRLQAVMDGTYITETRTGASGGIAAKYLARKNSRVVGIIGAGVQGKTQLLALSKVFPTIKEAKVFDISPDNARTFATLMTESLHINVCTVATIREAADADIVVTATPSRKPIVNLEYIRSGTHINGIGADASGKQELAIELLKKAKIVVDNMEQATHSGQVIMPLSQKLMQTADIYGTLGEVVAKTKKGRENEQEITIFDSTGLAIQDIACANLVYKKALGRGYTSCRIS